MLLNSELEVNDALRNLGTVIAGRCCKQQVAECLNYDHPADGNFYYGHQTCEDVMYTLGQFCWDMILCGSVHTLWSLLMVRTSCAFIYLEVWGAFLLADALCSCHRCHVLEVAIGVTVVQGWTIVIADGRRP